MEIGARYVLGLAALVVILAIAVWKVYGSSEKKLDRILGLLEGAPPPAPKEKAKDGFSA